jgi:Ca2+-binding EF-hand superfamily protein
MSNPDPSGFINYREFSVKCREMIESLFSIKSITEKAELIEGKQFVPQADIDKVSKTPLELFELFKKYDRNQNGFLEIAEYIQCLKEAKIDLQHEEIVTLALSSDVNGDERIDYEEFMKHFQDCLKMVRFQSTLQQAYNDYSASLQQ